MIQLRKKPPTSRELLAEERRRQLLQVAKDLFAEKGFHATPIRAINRAIGMADGLIYHYFPQGKQQILETIVQEAFENRYRVMKQVSTVISKEVPLRQVLLTLAERMYEFIISDRQSTLIMIRERNHLSDDFVSKLSELITDRMNWIADLLKERHEAGEIAELDYPIAAKQIVSMNFMFLLRDISGIDVIHESHKEFVEKTIDQLVKFWSIKQM